MPRALTTRQRITRLYDNEAIDADELEEMLAIERANRGELQRIFATLPITYREYFERYEGFVVCNSRRNRHAWEDIPFVRDITVYGTPEASRCIHCQTEKVECFTYGNKRRTMEPRYFHREGCNLRGIYKALTAGDRFVLRQELRLRRRLAALEGDNPSVMRQLHLVS